MSEELRVCNCREVCKGQDTLVPLRKWYRHAQHRNDIKSLPSFVPQSNSTSTRKHDRSASASGGEGGSSLEASSNAKQPRLVPLVQSETPGSATLTTSSPPTTPIAQSAAEIPNENAARVSSPSSACASGQAVTPTSMDLDSAMVATPPPSPTLSLQELEDNLNTGISSLGSWLTVLSSYVQGPVPPPPVDEDDTPEPGSLEELEDTPEDDVPPSQPSSFPRSMLHPDVLEPLPDDVPSQIQDISTAQEFIRLLRDASLAQDNLPADALERLRNPPREAPDVSDPVLRFSICIFLALSNSSQESYNRIRAGFSLFAACFPDAGLPGMQLLSYDQIKRRIAELSGVVPIIHEMCVNTCLAFTGPFDSNQAILPDSQQALSIIQNADHHTLVYSRNPTYQALLQEKDDFRMRVAMLTAENNTLKFRSPGMPSVVKYEEEGLLLTAAMSGAKAEGTISLPHSEVQVSLRSADYPDIKYWKVETYRDEKKKRKQIAKLEYTPGHQHESDESENAMMWYVEDENGEEIETKRAIDIRSLSRAIFEQLLKADQAPKKWGEISCQAQEFYYAEMYKRYLELRYCDGNWKARKVAIDGYPSWYKGRVKGKKSSVKREIASSGDESRSLKGTKTSKSTESAETVHLDFSDPEGPATTRSSPCSTESLVPVSSASISSTPTTVPSTPATAAPQIQSHVRPVVRPRKKLAALDFQPNIPTPESATSSGVDNTPDSLEPAAQNAATDSGEKLAEPETTADIGHGVTDGTEGQETVDPSMDQFNAETAVDNVHEVSETCEDNATTLEATSKAPAQRGTLNSDVAGVKSNDGLSDKKRHGQSTGKAGTPKKRKADGLEQDKHDGRRGAQLGLCIPPDNYSA
ncbi:hypothetical protein EWM64_g6941 [Hericium alpestre]|uniref:Uncharacterized protein n=1 Tax=Hericium alpestre TaxID=135208 RepID=A0A4Y9ZQM1_9AGAM|nr:hypothetical protein EWM64_g6941 [Hericium alpestre]